MTKTCGKCGHAALDDKAQFCNRCGAPVPDRKQPEFPVCPKCGTVVTDELAQFCNRCGTKIPPVPIICSSCGSPAIDDRSRFCTRCGTTFEQKPVPKSRNCPSCGAPDLQGTSVFCNRCGAPFSRQGSQAAHQPVQIVTQRKTAGSLPVVTITDNEWVPWTDTSPVAGLPGSAGPAMPEQPRLRDRQVAVPQKRYAHLPLVADETKKKGPHAPDVPGGAHKKKTVSQKKGVLGFLDK